MVAAAVALAAAAAAAAAVWGLARPEAPALRGTAVSPPYPAADFVLTDQQGRPFQLAAQRGKPVLVFFGYTFCPDVCPGTMLQYRALRQALGADADRVALLFVTVDPERDSPERLRTYLDNFDPAIVGLTGTPETVASVTRQWGVYAEKVPVPGSATGYLVNHSAILYLVDRAGMVRALYPYGTPTADILHDVRVLLARRSGPAQAAVRIEGAWARPAEVDPRYAGDGATGGTGAVYMTLVNPGPEPDRLVEVRTEVARRAQVHASRMEGGVVRMEPVPAVELPPRSRVALEPGGLHIMLMGLERRLAEGDRVPLVLRFERAGEVPLDVEVRAGPGDA